MSNKLKKEIENLAEIVKRYPDGISVKELLQSVNDSALKDEACN